MSKPVKKMMQRELAGRLEGVSSLAVVGFTGIDAITTHMIRGRLREKKIALMVVKNAMARHAFDSIGLPEAKDLLAGPCAVAFSTDPEALGVVEVVRELVEIGTKAPNLTVKAALLEGQTFGPDRIAELKNYPTRSEAQSKALSCVLGPGGKLSACLAGPGAVIASLLKSIESKREEEGGSEAQNAA